MTYSDPVPVSTGNTDTETWSLGNILPFGKGL